MKLSQKQVEYYINIKKTVDGKDIYYEQKTWLTGYLCASGDIKALAEEYRKIDDQPTTIENFFPIRTRLVFFFQKAFKKTV